MGYWVSCSKTASRASSDVAIFVANSSCFAEITSFDTVVTSRFLRSRFFFFDGLSGAFAIYGIVYMAICIPYTVPQGATVYAKEQYYDLFTTIFELKIWAPFPSLSLIQGVNGFCN